MIGVGSKVVCKVNWPNDGHRAPIAKGEVLTVRKVVTQKCDGKRGYYFEEKTNQPRQFDEGVVEPGYMATYFRPVREIKTDISIFQQIDRDVFGRVDA
jgi:hypothetical protein